MGAEEVVAGLCEWDTGGNGKFVQPYSLIPLGRD